MRGKKRSKGERCLRHIANSGREKREISLLCRHLLFCRGLFRRPRRLVLLRARAALGKPLGPLLRARLLLGLQDLLGHREAEALRAGLAPCELGRDLLGRRRRRGRDRGGSGGGRFLLLLLGSGSCGDDDLLLDERDAKALGAGLSALELGGGAGGGRGGGGGGVLCGSGGGGSVRSGGGRSRRSCGRRLGGLFGSE